MAVLRHERALRAPGGPAAAVVPARGGGPGLVGGRLRAGGIRPLRARRRGPGRDREHGPAAEPQRVRHPRGAGPAARDPAPAAGHADRRGQARDGPAGVRRPGARAVRGRGPVRVPARVGLAQAPRGERHRGRRGGAVEPRAVLRDRPGPVGAARGRSRRVLRPPPPDAHPGGRRPAHGRHRPRRGRGRRDDRAQGEGPRVPGRLPARPRLRAVPDDVAPRAAGAPGGARQRDAARRATTSSRRSAGCSTSG